MQSASLLFLSARYIRPSMATAVVVFFFSFFLITDKLIGAEIALQAGVNYNPVRIKQTAINFLYRPPPTIKCCWAAEGDDDARDK